MSFQVQHPGSAPRFSTQAQHPGSAPRFSTQVQHPGSAPRCSTQAQRPGAEPRLSTQADRLHLGVLCAPHALGQYQTNDLLLRDRPNSWLLLCFTCAGAIWLSRFKPLAARLRPRRLSRQATYPQKFGTYSRARSQGPEPGAPAQGPRPRVRSRSRSRPRLWP
jgi:hypothetical protein